MNTGKSGVGEIKFVDVPYLIQHFLICSGGFENHTGKFSVQSRIKILHPGLHV